KQNFPSFVTDHIKNDASGGGAGRSHGRIQEKARVVSIYVTRDERIEWKPEKCGINCSDREDRPDAERFHQVPNELRVANDQKSDLFREGRGKVPGYATGIKEPWFYCPSANGLPQTIENLACHLPATLAARNCSENEGNTA